MATVPGLAKGLGQGRESGAAAVRPRGGRLRPALASVGLLMALAAGCVTTGVDERPEAPPKPGGVACQVVAAWQNSVMYAADPAHGGNPTPGFAARVYLFGPEVGTPLVAEGDLTFDLIDETTGEPRWLERWTLDPETVKRLLRKDMIGWGYTVFLPSREVRPEMTKVRMRTAFHAAKRAPVYAENAVTLAPTNGVIRTGTAPFHLPGKATTPGAPPRAENAGPTLPPPTPAK